MAWGRKSNKDWLLPDAPISQEHLAFLTGKFTVDGHSFQVGFMPFDLQEVEGLSDERKWEHLRNEALEYAKRLGDVPETAHKSKLSHHWMSYCSFSQLVSIKNAVSQIGKGNGITIPDKLFNNAFDKIILPAGYRENIIETVSQMKEHKKLFDDWGLGEKIKRGQGINMLFSGPSGTGKTYCGEVVADYLGVEAEIISVSTIESKWVGGSEKNVSDLFRALNGTNKVLILDEVDSFLLSRSSSDHQHHSKLTNQFLIELERHNGVVIMTTNRPVKLDRALQRRIDLVLDFPEPSAKAREQIWRYMIPSKMPISNADPVDYTLLSTYELNGGNIKNAVLSAARKAVTAGTDVSMALLSLAAEEEVKEKEVLLGSQAKDHS